MGYVFEGLNSVLGFVIEVLSTYTSGFCFVPVTYRVVRGTLNFKTVPIVQRIGCVRARSFIRKSCL
jgi:hypothetical protein